MIGPGKAALKIFVALEPCDMRKSFNGLFDAAGRHLKDGKLGTDMLFVFVNKRKDRIKLLYFDGTGLWVAAKRHATQCPFWFFDKGSISLSPAFWCGA